MFGCGESTSALAVTHAVPTASPPEFDKRLDELLRSLPEEYGRERLATVIRAASDLAAESLAKPFGFFGDFNVVATYSAGTSFAEGILSEAERTAIENTLLVIPQHGDPLEIEVGADKACVRGASATNIEGVCKTVYRGERWCPEDEIHKRFVGLDALYDVSDRVLCSAVAVAPTIIATASHCVPKLADGDRGGVVVANYVHSDPAFLEIKQGALCFPKADVYRISGVDDSRAYRLGGNQGEDLDALTLNVTPVVPGAESRLTGVSMCSGTPEVDMHVYMRGHPFGFPQYKAGCATVLRTEDNGIVKTNLDAFDGFSGSPVFSETRHCLLAIETGSRHAGTSEKCCRFSSGSAHGFGSLLLRYTQSATISLASEQRQQTRKQQ